MPIPTAAPSAAPSGASADGRPTWRPVLPPHLLGPVAAVLTVLIWTAFIVVARASADPSRAPTLTPLDIVLCRLLGAGMVGLPLGWWLQRRATSSSSATANPPAGANASALAAAAPGGRRWEGSLLGCSPLPLAVTCATGVLGGLLYPVFAYSAFVFAPAAHASVLMPGSLPLWASLLAWIFMGERPGAARWLGLVCIVAGDLLVGGGSLLHALSGGGVWRGDLLFVTASIVWACYTLLVRKWSLPAVHATVAITVFGFVVYVPLYALLAGGGVVESHFLRAPWQDILHQMAMQGWGSVVISGITFNLMIRHYGAVRSTMITALVPGLSATAAAVVLGEPLAWNVSAGLALVTLGILFGVRGMRTGRA